MKTKAFLSFLPIFVIFASAKAAMVVTIEEQGSDVVASYSGSIDLTGIGFDIFGSASGESIVANLAQMYLRNDEATKGSLTAFGKIPWSVAPSAFGPGIGESVDPDSFSVASGNAFGFNSGGFYIEPEYVSGSSISGSMTFNDQTLTTMGIDVGTMNATFSSGDTLTLTAIPEPNSYGFLLGAAGLATAIFFRRRRRSSAV